MNVIDYTAEVQHGAQLLDQKAPLWWTKDGPMNLDELDVSSANNCVTAQSVGRGSYIKGTAFLGLAGTGTQVRHGFYLHSDTVQERKRELIAAGEWDNDMPYDALLTKVYAPLTAAWKKLIQDRRDAASAPVLEHTPLDDVTFTSECPACAVKDTS